MYDYLFNVNLDPLVSKILEARDFLCCSIYPHGLTQYFAHIRSKINIFIYYFWTSRLVLFFTIICNYKWAFMWLNLWRVFNHVLRKIPRNRITDFIVTCTFTRLLLQCGSLQNSHHYLLFSRYKQATHPSKADISFLYPWMTCLDL